jgi:hypothetical protein
MGWYPVSFPLFSKPLTSGASLVHGGPRLLITLKSITAFRAGPALPVVAKYLLVLTSTGTYLHLLFSSIFQ